MTDMAYPCSWFHFHAPARRSRSPDPGIGCPPAGSPFMMCQGFSSLIWFAAYLKGFYCVIAGAKAHGSPLGELSPKVTERALQALPISSGRCSNGTHLRLVIARSEATWQSRSTRYDNRKTIGESVTAFPRLHPKGTSSRFALGRHLPLRGLAMTRRKLCRIRRGAGTNSQAPPLPCHCESEASLALPTGRAVTEGD